MIPTPFTAADRAAGYCWELSMRQVEVVRTLVFDDPRRARGFFESLVTDNIGIGRPSRSHAVFGRQPTVGRTTLSPSRTRVFSPGTEVKMDFSYKHSRVKQYLKEGRALRIETVINKPADIGVLARLEHLPELVEQGPPGQRPSAYDRTCRPGLCHRLCALRAHPPALRTGGPTNRSLALRGSTRHGPGRCTLPRRPRRHRLHQQEPSRAGGRTPRQGLQLLADELRPAPPPPPRADRAHAAGTNSYTLTPEGIRVAVFYTKLQARLLGPLLEADKPPAPLELRRALATIEHVLGDYVTNARLGVAA